MAAQVDEYPNLWELSLPELLPWWDRIDGAGRSIAGIRALCRVDRYYLLVKVLGRTDMLHPWVYARCREVERAPDGYLDLWGREMFKSSIITQGGIIQEILRDPEITACIFSHTKPIAKAFLALIKRELESNQTLKGCFPDILYENPERQSPMWNLDALIVKRRTNPKEATLEATGLVDGMPTSKHFKLMVYDDVVTKESVSTPEQIQKTTESWELSDNLGVVGGRKWHIGTRYHYGDTYDAILKRGAVQPRLYPATEDGTITGKPVLLTQEQWDEKVRFQGDAVIACQMLQNPLAGTQRMFNVEDLQTYEVRPETVSVYILIDPARSKKKDSANTAMVVLALDYAANKYLLDGFNHKMDLQERWKRIKELWLKWYRAPGVQACRVGYEDFGAQADMDYFNERRTVEKCPVPIETVSWPREGDGSKVDRVQRLGPDVRSHRLYLPYPTDPKNMTSAQREMEARGYGYRVSKPIRWKDENGNLYDLTEQFKMQLSFFPFGGLKDLPDAMSRIYDLEATPPVIYQESALEPAFV